MKNTSLTLVLSYVVVDDMFRNENFKNVLPAERNGQQHILFPFFVTFTAHTHTHRHTHIEVPVFLLCRNRNVRMSRK